MVSETFVELFFKFSFKSKTEKLYALYIICFISFVFGMLNLGSNSLINLQKYSFCTIANGRKSQINQSTKN